MTGPYGDKTTEEVLTKVIELFDVGNGDGVSADQIADALEIPRYVAVNHLIDLKQGGRIELLRDGNDQTCIVTSVSPRA